MAAERTLVDLQAVAAGCQIPYSTLARWAVRRGWTVHRQVGHRRFYDYDTVRKAVLAATRAREQRQAA